MMYCSGGRQEENFEEDSLSCVNVYNFYTREWNEFAEMRNISSIEQDLFCVNDTIYAIDIQYRYAYVEKYEPSIDRWTNPTTKYRVSESTLERSSYVLHDNSIYIIFWNGKKMVSYVVTQQCFREHV